MYLVEGISNERKSAQSVVCKDTAYSIFFELINTQQYAQVSVYSKNAKGDYKCIEIWQKKKTNFEKVTESPETLAELLCKEVAYPCDICSFAEKCKGSANCYASNKKEWLKWLKQQCK